MTISFKKILSRTYLDQDTFGESECLYLIIKKIACLFRRIESWYCLFHSSTNVLMNYLIHICFSTLTSSTASIYSICYFRFLIRLYSLCLLANNQSVLYSYCSQKLTYTPLYTIYILYITSTKSINIATHTHTYICIHKEYYCPLFLIIGKIYCSNFQLLEAIFQHRYKCITKITLYNFVYHFMCLSNRIKSISICKFIISSFILNWFYPVEKPKGAQAEGF